MKHDSTESHQPKIVFNKDEIRIDAMDMSISNLCDILKKLGANEQDYNARFAVYYVLPDRFEGLSFSEAEVFENAESGETKKLAKMPSCHISPPITIYDADTHQAVITIFPENFGMYSVGSRYCTIAPNKTEALMRLLKRLKSLQFWNHFLK